jgi:hypothetical protein
MTTIIFDSTTHRNASATFGRGLVRPTDAFGNPIPVAPASDADVAWKADQDRSQEEFEAIPVEMSDAERYHASVFHLEQALPWEQQELAEFGCLPRHAV